MTDKMREELDDIAVLTALREAGATEKELAILTYESGPYEITKPTVFMQKLASVLAAKSVPVVGEAVAEAYVYEDVDGDDILGLRLLKEDYPMQHGEKLYIEPTTSITHAELERLRKDAERYRWLRDDAFEHSEDCFLEAGRLFAGHQGDSFDVAIDAAIVRAAAAIGEGMK